jgi:hypothetical protein
MADQGTSISQVLATMHDTTSGEETSIDDVLNAFGRRAYGPVLFIIGLISLSPVGAIPGSSILFGTLVVLMMTQYIARDRAPWVPLWIRQRSISTSQAEEAVAKVQPYLERMETVVRPRFHRLVSSPWTHIAAAVCIVMALTMYPLALVPWGVIPPSLALTLFGLGLMSADGLLIGAGLAASGIALAILIWIFSAGSLF